MPVYMSKNVLFNKQGHRGCRGLMPENTLVAMKNAIELGVTTLEMDVVITKDHHVILSHEAFFSHELTTKPDGTYIKEVEEKNFNIYKMTYEEVKRYDVGMKPHPRFPHQQKIKSVKPLLTELIVSIEFYTKQLHRPEVFYNIETKTQQLTDNIYHPPPEIFVDLLMNIIVQKRIEKRVIIQSFDFRTLQYLHRKFPTIKTAMLIEDFDKRSFLEQLNSLGFNPTIYSPHYSLVNKILVNECQQKNIEIIPWTVNDLQKMKELKKIGVHGIISDFPDLFRKL